MNKATYIALWAASVCAAFAIGATVVRARRPETQSGQPSVKAGTKKPESDRVLHASLKNLRRDLTKKERKIRDLETKLREVRAKSALPLTAKEVQERKRVERQQDLFDKAKALRKKMVQREDKDLWEEGLDELSALVQSNKTEDLLLGLTSILHLDGLDFDAETFKSQIVTSLSHETPEIREAALNCLSMVFSDNEALDFAFSMATDPSAQVRASAAFHLGWLSNSGPDEDAETLLTSLIKDDDEAVGKRALEVLSHVYADYSPAERAQNIEGVVADLSGDSRMASAVLDWWQTKGEFSPELARRCGSMLLEGYIEFMGQDGMSDRGINLLAGPQLDHDAEPIVSLLCLRLLRDSQDDNLRVRALTGLRGLGDPSVLADLEAITGTGAAEGIEEPLAKTIEHLRQSTSQAL